MLIRQTNFTQPSFVIVDNDPVSNTTLYALYSEGGDDPVCLLVVQFQPGTGTPSAVGVLSVDEAGITPDYMRQVVHGYRNGHCPVSGLTTFSERKFARTDRYMDYTTASISHLNRLMASSIVAEAGEQMVLQHQDVELISMPMPNSMRMDEVILMAEKYRVARIRMTMEQVIVDDKFKPRQNVIAAIANGAVVFPVQASNLAIVTFLGQGHVGAVVSAEQHLQYELGILEFTSYRTICTLLKSYLY